MRRWFGIAALNLIVLALPAWAQHGGGHASGGGSHSSSFHSAGFSSHSSGAFHGGYAGANAAHSYARNFGTRVRVGSSYYHRGFYGRRGYYPYYPYGLYYPYNSWYMDSGYASDDDRDESSNVNAEANGPPAYRDDGLQRDVQTLNGKIDRLQAGVEARNRRQPELEPSTALVFRDRHVEEVRNYAISGGTLWVLNEQAAKKIPLAELDLDATVKMNDDRGVDFQLPK